MPKSVQLVEPLPGFAVLKEYKLNEKIAGRFLMPTDAQSAPSIGEVVSVGESVLHVSGDEYIEAKVAVGDVVAYQNYGGQELQLEGQKYFLVPFDKLLAKLNIKEQA
jgi:co-chaperonin GroES (HSP10)